MALCYKWDAKNDFAYVLQFFSLISDGLGSVQWDLTSDEMERQAGWMTTARQAAVSSDVGSQLPYFLV